MKSSNLFLLCHSKSGDILYKSQSQDEDALVRAAAELQMVFASKNGNVLGKSSLLWAVMEGTVLIVARVI